MRHGIRRMNNVLTALHTIKPDKMKLSTAFFCIVTTLSPLMGEARNVVWGNDNSFQNCRVFTSNGSPAHNVLQFEIGIFRDPSTNEYWNPEGSLPGEWVQYWVPLGTSAISEQIPYCFGGEVKIGDPSLRGSRLYILGYSKQGDLSTTEEAILLTGDNEWIIDTVEPTAAPMICGVSSVAKVFWGRSTSMTDGVGVVHSGLGTFLHGNPGIPTLELQSARVATNLEFLKHPDSVFASEGEKIELRIAAFGPADTSFQWFRNGQPVSDTLGFRGANSPIIQFEADPVRSGKFECRASVAGGETTWSKSAQVTTIYTLNDGQGQINSFELGRQVEIQICPPGEASNHTVTGLPRGLRFNRSTGRIEGSPALAGRFKVGVSIKDAAGRLSKTVRLITINQLEAQLAGGFDGIVYRGSGGPLMHGGRLTLQVSGTTTTVTGKLALGSSTRVFTAQLQQTTSGVTVSAIISKPLASDVALECQIDRLTGELAGSIRLSPGGETVEVMGARHLVGAGKGLVPATMRGLISIEAAETTTQTGSSSFGRLNFALGKQGQVSAVGRFNDGAVLTFSSHLRNGGVFGFYAVQTPQQRSLLGEGMITVASGETVMRGTLGSGLLPMQIQEIFFGGRLR